MLALSAAAAVAAASAGAAAAAAASAAAGVMIASASHAVLAAAALAASASPAVLAAAAAAAALAASFARRPAGERSCTVEFYAREGHLFETFHDVATNLKSPRTTKRLLGQERDKAGHRCCLGQCRCAV